MSCRPKTSIIFLSPSFLLAFATIAGCSESGGANGESSVETEAATETETEAATETETEAATETDEIVEQDTGTLTDIDSETRNDTLRASDWDTAGFDNREPVYPAVREGGGSGNVTTYGDVTNPSPSRGGACNYGATGILSYAAIHVNVAPGDEAGPWSGGRICGQCAEVRVETPSGIRSTVVRIVDKCPDDYCGIDLGGLPAQVLMGTQPGRYDGTWELVPCEGHPDVSDGAPSLFVKEGSSEHWSIIHVRNPPAAVRAVSWSSAAGSGELEWAVEAENFFSVPEVVRSSDEPVTLFFEYDFGLSSTITLSGRDLGIPEALYPIP